MITFSLSLYCFKTCHMALAKFCIIKWFLSIPANSVWLDFVAGHSVLPRGSDRKLFFKKQNKEVTSYKDEY